MLEKLKLLETMSAMASHSAKRHAVLAENIANADTPNYEAKDIKPFSEVMADAEKQGVSVRQVSSEMVALPVHDIRSPNGNTVSLEEHMMLSTQTKGEHDMALAVYKKTLDILRLAASTNR